MSFAYLHEAGHAIVALEIGMEVRSVRCDSLASYTDAKSVDADNAVASVFAERDAGRLDGEALLHRGAIVSHPRLVVMMGGIAADSLVKDTEPIVYVRRAGDDLATFYAYLNAMTRNLTAAQFQPVWETAFTGALDDAWGIVCRRESDVRTIAALLEQRGELTGEEVAAALTTSSDEKDRPHA